MTVRATVAQWLLIQSCDGEVVKTSTQLNLRDALRRLHCPDESRVLWVDLICVDQDNKHEKDLQVAMMATRCSVADNVCI